MTYEDIRKVALTVLGMHPETQGDLRDILRKSRNTNPPYGWVTSHATLCGILADAIDCQAEKLRDLPLFGINEADRSNTNQGLSQ